MRTAVITGASGNLGRTLVEVFNKREWNVIGTGRSQRPDDLDELILYSSFDASNLEECRTFWSSVPLGAGELCLVNNAGNYHAGPFLEQQASSVVESIEGCFFTAAHMTRGLMERSRVGRIVNIVSDSALAPHDGNATYGSAKAAMAHFFGSLQAERSSENYRITNLYPGSIAADATANRAMTAIDLADFVEQIATSTSSFYVKDCTIEPVANT